MSRFSFLFILAFSFSVSGADSYQLKLQADNPLALQRYLDEEGYDVAGANRFTGEVSVVTQFPFRIFVEQGDLAQNPELRFKIVSQEKSEPFLTFAARENLADAGSYFGVQESIEELKRLEQAYPNWVKVFNLNQFLGAEKTLEGNEIFAAQVSLNPSQIEDEPKILILGQHHARELTTQHAVLDSAKDLLEKAKNNDALAVNSLKTKAIWFVPVLNPDGLNHVLKSDRMWRKNRAKNQDGTRGVDLNRNYDFKWGACGMHSADPKHETYKGVRPNSEPEIRLMHQLNERLHFQFSVSYHSYGNEVLNPYLCAELAEKEVYFRIRDLLSSSLGFGQRLPSSSGEDHEYHYNKFGTLSFLLEIGEEFQPPFSVYENTVRPTVLKVLPTVLGKAFVNTTKIRVVDAETDQPLQAVLHLNELGFKEGEARVTDTFGSYYWELPKKSFQLLVEKQGYEANTFLLGESVGNAVVKLRRPRFGLNGFELLARFLPFVKS